MIIASDLIFSFVILLIYRNRLKKHAEIEKIRTKMYDSRESFAISGYNRLNLVLVIELTPQIHIQTKLLES